MKKVESIKVGQAYSRKFIATDEIIHAIANVSGDRNPVHLDETYAADSVFGRRIAHGLFCLNGISMILGNFFPGEGAVLIHQEFFYKKPVFVNDEIEITVKVQNIHMEREIVELECICCNQENQVVLAGSSTVKWSGDLP